MRLSFFSLPIALALISPALAGILEENGYEIESFEGVDSVAYIDKQGDYLLVGVIGFYPEMGAATIYYVNNDIQPESESKLGLEGIYNVLAEKHNCKPDDVKWLAFNVMDDEETDNLISSIRASRKPGTKEFRILPNDHEWDMILKTKYYKQAALVNRRPLDRIVVKTHYRLHEGYIIPIDRIQFSFQNLEDAEANDEDSQPFNGDEQEAQMMALYEEQEQKGMDTLAETDPELVQMILALELGDEAPAP
ncbi:hypothetical protein Cpir12675_000609 [Ceratocystis pirilliformis]|uniref:Uncharacterized protein n=1 Tax=Ceratocystis pirilliformis TaxID=259994 RepID=A0ABR3ZN27_9PEZI